MFCKPAPPSDSEPPAAAPGNAPEGKVLGSPLLPVVGSMFCKSAPPPDSGPPAAAPVNAPDGTAPGSPVLFLLLMCILIFDSYVI